MGYHQPYKKIHGDWQTPCFFLGLGFPHRFRRWWAQNAGPIASGTSSGMQGGGLEMISMVSVGIMEQIPGFS